MISCISTHIVTRYQVSITTGDLWNAGTDANVYLTIYGERGDTGVRQMYQAETQEKFLKGEVREPFVLFRVIQVLRSDFSGKLKMLTQYDLPIKKTPNNIQECSA